MNIRLNKNELAGALTALGKLVSRTSPIEAFRSVEIKGHNNAVTFRTASLNETICYRVPAETMEEFATLVLFDDFRNAVRGCKTKKVELEWNGTFLIVDATVMPGIADTLPVPDSIPDNARCTSLPENFVELLGIAAPIVNRNDYRKALQGICIESEGIAVTNGKELLHIPLELDTDKFTLPFPGPSLCSLESLQEPVRTGSNGGDTSLRSSTGLSCLSAFFRMQLIRRPWLTMLPHS